MKPAAMAGAALCFGRFSLRPATRELLADGQPLRVGARAFDLLLALAERGGDAVSRDELFERAWPGRVVVEDNLKVQVMALRRLLGADAVVTVPGHGYRLALPVRRDAAAADASPPPAATALFGRDADLAAVLTALDEHRLVTLLGPGGVGKTSLALAVADAARRASGASLPRYADGAAFVELASLSDGHALAPTLWRALQLPPRAGPLDAGALAAALRPLALLLVLDNCEHLRVAVAALAETLLAGAPQLVVLATSQEPLSVPGEHGVRLAGLACPAAGETSPARLASSPAVALFVARVRAADARFALTEDNAAAVAEICWRLDGLPLALELAAARTPMLGAAGVAERLGQRLQMLTRGAPDAPARHQTLRSALQWSCSLLDAAQQAAFRRLGVFAGGFPLRAALHVVCGEAPSGGEWAALDTLSTLVDKSLVQVLSGDGDARRMRLFESARAYALERLAESGEGRDARRRHAESMLAQLDDAEAAFHGAPLKPWIDGLLPELDNLRAALRWACGDDGDADLAFALAGAAGSLQAAGGLDDEARHWLDVVRPLLDDSRAKPRVARYWMARALRLVTPTASVAEGVDAARRAAALYDELGDVVGCYRMLGLVVQHVRRIEPQADVQPLLERMRALEPANWNTLMRLPRLAAEGRLMARAGDWAGYRERFRVEAALQAEAGDEMRAWGSAYHVALADIALGEPARAIAVLEPVVARIRELGLLRQQWTRPAMLLMARIEALGGRDCAPAVCETVTLLRIANAPSWLSDHFAWWTAQLGADDDAARLVGWSDAATLRRGEPTRHHHNRHAHERALALLEPRLGAGRLAALRDEGREMLDDAALQLVLRNAR